MEQIARDGRKACFYLSPSITLDSDLFLLQLSPDTDAVPDVATSAFPGSTCPTACTAFEHGPVKEGERSYNINLASYHEASRESLTHSALCNFRDTDVTRRSKGFQALQEMEEPIGWRCSVLKSPPRKLRRTTSQGMMCTQLEAERIYSAF